MLQLCGIEIAPEYGGSGASFTASLGVVEEIGKEDMGTAGLLEVHT